MPEPRVLLLHWNKGKWQARERPQQALTENSCESWIFAFDGDFLNTDLATPSVLKEYDIIIANSDYIHVEQLSKLSAARPATCKWVTLVEGQAHDFVKPRPFIRELFDNSDLVNCINASTEPYFKRLTSAPVKFIGFPYPVEGIRALSTPMEKRRREIFLSPMLLGRWLEYFTVNDLGIPLYGYEKKLSRTIRNVAKNLRQHRSLDRMYFQKKVAEAYKDPSLEILREVPLEDFFKRNSAAYLWLNMDPRYTWGRYVLDAAALQIPIIATRSTGQAEHFFPELMIENEFEIGKVRDLVQRLFHDEDFYRSVSTIPLEKFSHLRPEVKKRELMDALYSK